GGERPLPEGLACGVCVECGQRFGLALGQAVLIHERTEQASESPQLLPEQFAVVAAQVLQVCADVSDEGHPCVRNGWDALVLGCEVPRPPPSERDGMIHAAIVVSVGVGDSYCGEGGGVYVVRFGVDADQELYLAVQFVAFDERLAPCVELVTANRHRLSLRGSAAWIRWMSRWILIWRAYSASRFPCLSASVNVARVFHARSRMITCHTSPFLRIAGLLIAECPQLSEVEA